jgi:hypothetical protein
MDGNEISRLGWDPITGLSGEEKSAQWSPEIKSLAERLMKVRWWNIAERIRLRRESALLRQRMGLQ